MPTAASLLLRAAFLIMAAVGMSGCHRQTQADYETILTNSHIWGKDFPLALAEVHNWQQAGEGKVTISRGRMIGETQFKKHEDARLRIEQLNKLSNKFQDQLKQVNKFYFAYTKKTPDIEHPFAIQEAPEIALIDRIVKVTTSNRARSLLAADLTASILQAQIGMPDQVEHKIVRGKFDGRSESLTIYHYSKGGVQFVDSSYSAPLPGKSERVIERAILDTNRVEEAVSQAVNK